MTKTIPILSHYLESTCEVLNNCSVKIRNLIVRRNLKMHKLISFDVNS